MKIFDSVIPSVYLVIAEAFCGDKSAEKFIHFRMFLGHSGTCAISVLGTER